VRVEEIHWRGQARAIEDAAEAWKAEHDFARAVYALEAMLRACLSLSDFIKKAMAAIWEDLFSEKLEDVSGYGERLHRLFRHTLLAFKAAGAAAASARLAGYTVENAEEVVQAETHLRRLYGDFHLRWPHFDLDKLHKLETTPPEFVDAEDVYREFPELHRQDQR
jgi:hypothetical protein